MRSPKANFNSNYNLPCIAISFIIIVCENGEEDYKLKSNWRWMVEKDFVSKAGIEVVDFLQRFKDSKTL